MLKVTRLLVSLPSCSFTRGKNLMNLLFRREHGSVLINFSIKIKAYCLFTCALFRGISSPCNPI